MLSLTLRDQRTTMKIKGFAQNGTGHCIAFLSVRWVSVAPPEIGNVPSRTAFIHASYGHLEVRNRADTGTPAV